MNWQKFLLSVPVIQNQYELDTLSTQQKPAVRYVKQPWKLTIRKEVRPSYCTLKIRNKNLEGHQAYTERCSFIGCISLVEHETFIKSKGIQNQFYTKDKK